MGIMKIFNDFKKRFIEMITLILYPIIIIYIYYVFIGVYVMEQNRIGSNYFLIIFTVFNILIIYTLVFFLRIYPLEDLSTKDLFYPNIDDSITKEINFNMFFVDKINKLMVSHRVVCEVCGVLKPPRTHHCKKCNRCFLKMDHHCFVINECIGWHNYKFFIVFLILNSSMCAFIIVFFMIECMKKIATKYLVNYVVCMVVVFCSFMFSTTLFIYHVKLLFANETTVENIAINSYVNNTDNGRAQEIFQEGMLAHQNLDSCEDPKSLSRDALNPYNVGMWENFKEVFGDNYLFWFLPIFTSRGNGIDFPKNIKSDTDELFADII